MSVPTSANDTGFLSRWSRRKLQAGGDPAPAASPVTQAPSPVAQAAGASVSPPVPVPAQDQTPPPTLDDLAPLDHTADLSRFIAKGVDEGVRRAALRKLFADPQFNVMDGLDTYIDDYNTPSPVPPGFLARLKLVPNLGLHSLEPEPEAATAELEQSASERASSTPEGALPAFTSEPSAAAQPERAPLPDAPDNIPFTPTPPSS